MSTSVPIREQLARLHERLEHEKHQRKQIAQIVQNLTQSGSDSSRSFLALRHELDTLDVRVAELRSRIESLESRLRTVTAHRIAIVVALISTVGSIVGAALALLG